MNNIKINIPEGFEIDKENSSLETGDIVFKKVKSKYPYIFYYDYTRDGETVDWSVSEKYAIKLDVLDTLLCLRDEYNRIDGFTEGFRFGEQNWCIVTYEKNLEIAQYCVLSRIMHFGKEETAKLFLKNFEEQLERIKEFL